jgi:protein translocase SecG subunit
MPPLKDLLLWTEIATATLLIITILSQQKSAGLGGAVSGGGGEHFTSGRGVDKILTWLTVIFAVIFFGGALGYLFI